MTTPLNSVEKSQAFSGRPSLDDLARELGRARAELWYWRALAAYREAEVADFKARNATLRERLAKALGVLRRRSAQVEKFGDALRASIPLSQAAQGRMCGNSVCPPLARALVAANVPELAVQREAAE